MDKPKFIRVSQAGGENLFAYINVANIASIHTKQTTDKYQAYPTIYTIGGGMIQAKESIDEIFEMINGEPFETSSNDDLEDPMEDIGIEPVFVD